MRIMSRAEKLNGPHCSKGAVSLISQDMTDSSTRRMTSASNNPVTRARSLTDGGSLSTRMAMKSRLSMPRTISRTTRVNSPTHAAGSSTHSIRSEEHTSELQSLMRISYAVFCLQKKKQNNTTTKHKEHTIRL